MAAVLKTPATLSLVLILPLAACARRTPTFPAPATEVPPQPGLHVLLTWSAPVDLDLYVTDPSSETVYFANNPSRTGMALVGDERCGGASAAGARREQVGALSPQPGRYRIGVDFIDDCGSGLDEAPFRVAVFHRGRRLETAGVARRDRFAPVVMELELTPSGELLPVATAPGVRPIAERSTGAKP